MSTNQTFVSLVSVLAELPSFTRTLRGDAHLAGIGLLVAEPCQTDWCFDLRIRVCGADGSPAPLLAWAADALPAAGYVIGWRLADQVVAPLLAAAEAADPFLACAFLDRLAPLVACGSDDLAVAHGGAGAPVLGVHLAANGIPGTAMTPGEAGDACRRGRQADVRRMIEIQTIALMDRWTRDNGEGAQELREALGGWLKNRGAPPPRL